MHARFAGSALVLRFGNRFGIAEAERLSETVRSFSPLSRVTLDFTEVWEFQESAYDLLARTLVAIGAPGVVLRGLTLQRAEVLRRKIATIRASPGSTQPCSPALAPLSC